MQFKDFYCVCTKFTHLPKHKFSLVPIAKVSINITNDVFLFFFCHFKAILASLGFLYILQSHLVIPELL